MLLLHLRVHSFTLAVFARAVNMNRYPCSTIATRRGKKGSETFIRLLRHVFLLNSFATSPPNLWSADTEISTNEKAPRESCRFPPEMGSKLHVRRNFVLLLGCCTSLCFCEKMVDSEEEEVGVLDQDFTPFTQSSPSYSVESETDQEVCKIFKKWNARKLPDSAKGGTVSKKSKIEPSIEPASLGAEDCKENVDVKGQCFSIKSFTRPYNYKHLK